MTSRRCRFRRPASANSFGGDPTAHATFSHDPICVSWRLGTGAARGLPDDHDGRGRARAFGDVSRLAKEKDSALRLSLYTDLSLRLLLYLGAVEAGTWTTTPAVARAFGVSLHHLQKVARGLTEAGYIEARQGRAGGVRLARPAVEVRLGAVVAELEGLGCLVECARGPCPLAGRCLLKHALDAAERSFVRELDRFSLADVLAGPTGAAMRDLIGREAGPGP